MTQDSGAAPGRDASPRYRLDSRIATGGMGEVWKATDTVLGRAVAMKLLKHEYADDPAFRSRFQAEAQHAASLHHPGIASVFDFGELPDETGGTPRPYLVMELVPGQPLSALLRGGEPMPAGTAADLVAQAADAVGAAHAVGIVHRDLKPANLLVTPEGTVKITDFGIARAADAAGVTQTGQVIGTPAYLSPEQAEGRQATPASDVYALGVVLYECLAGARPFTSDNPVSTALSHVRDAPPPLPADVPDHLRQSVAVALAKDPADRFGSMADFADALRGGAVPAGAAAATVPVDEAPATRVMTMPPAAATGARADRSRRRPGWLPWAGAAAAVLLVVLLVALLGRGEEPPPAGDTAVEEPTASSPPPEETPSESPTPEEPTGVEVVAEDYIGMAQDEATARLKALGLKVKDQEVENDGSAEEGTVADVVPTGTLQKGDEVTIFVHGPPPEEDPGLIEQLPPGQDHGKGPKKDKD